MKPLVLDLAKEYVFYFIEVYITVKERLKYPWKYIYKY